MKNNKINQSKLEPASSFKLTAAEKIKSMISFTVRNGLILLFLLIAGTSIRAQDKTQSLNEEQKTKIKTILSQYNNSTLTAQQAKEIHEKFRAAGIQGGAASKDAIIAAGFDPEKLRSLAPAPQKQGNVNAQVHTIEARLALVNEKIIIPLGVNAEQAESIKNAFSLFYNETDKLKKAQANPGEKLDKALMQPQEKARDEKIKKALSADLYAKYLELEKKSRPAKPDEKKNDLKK